jgi:pSer/pThr/pTyr-binding forkhead associated (FHA) protein/V8-like Glu-specific endopeptidase
MGIKFEFLAGALSGKTYEFTQEKITIGRGSNNDLVLDPHKDLDASKDHAVVTYEDGNYFISDKDSTNGTYVNGKRVERSEISNGDEIQFGKGGPKTKIICAGGGEKDAPKTRMARTMQSGKSGVGSQTVAMMIGEALDKAKSSDRGAIGGTAVFIKEAVNNALKKSSRTFKIVTSLVIVALIGAIVFLVMQGKSEKEKLEGQITEQQGQISQLSERTMNADDKQKFLKLLDEYHDSVVFIYSATTIYNSKGEQANLFQGFGTGFFVRDDGYIVTNKHVIYPWKFDEDKAYAIELAKALNFRIETFVCCWTNGARFRSGGNFSFEESFNTRDLNLEIVRTGEDRMTQVFSKPNWRTDIKVEVHVKDNNDIAILKATGGPFKSVKLYRGMGGYKPLEPVIVYGFPAGIFPQETAHTSASAAYGHIRKVENTIQVDASILPGNSGGPVFISDGSVIGIATRGFAETLNECIQIEHAMRLIPGF